MHGEIPLDEDDEGLESIELKTNSPQIIEYFTNAIDDYETELACNHFLSKPDS